MIVLGRQLVGEDRYRWILGCFGMFSGLPLGPVLVNAGLGVQLGIACQVQQRQPQTVDHL